MTIGGFNPVKTQGAPLLMSGSQGGQPRFGLIAQVKYHADTSLNGQGDKFLRKALETLRVSRKEKEEDPETPLFRKTFDDLMAKQSFNGQKPVDWEFQGPAKTNTSQVVIMNTDETQDLTNFRKELISTIPLNLLMYNRLRGVHFTETYDCFENRERVKDKWVRKGRVNGILNVYLKPIETPKKDNPTEVEVTQLIYEPRSTPPKDIKNGLAPDFFQMIAKILDSVVKTQPPQTKGVKPSLYSPATKPVQEPKPVTVF